MKNVKTRIFAGAGAGTFRAGVPWRGGLFRCTRLPLNRGGTNTDHRYDRRNMTLRRSTGISDGPYHDE